MTLLNKLALSSKLEALLPEEKHLSKQLDSDELINHLAMGFVDGHKSCLSEVKSKLPAMLEIIKGEVTKELNSYWLEDMKKWKQRHYDDQKEEFKNKIEKNKGSHYAFDVLKDEFEKGKFIGRNQALDDLLDLLK